MRTPSLLRSLATLAAPLTVVALALVIAAGATAGDAVESSPLALASSAVLFVVALALGSAALAAGRDRGVTGPAIAVVGSVLVAGGQWAALFVLPALTTHAPQLLTSGALSSVTVGYVASYAVFAVGWIATAVAMLRARAIPTWLGVLLIVGAVASLVPAPEAIRLLIVSIAVTLTARRIIAPATETNRVPQPA